MDCRVTSGAEWAAWRWAWSGHAGSDGRAVGLTETILQWSYRAFLAGFL